MKKRLVLGAMLSAFTILFGMMASPTEANPKVKLSLSSTLAPDTCLEIAADNFRDEIREKSDGRLEIVRYPSGELYDARAEIEAVARGNVDMGVLHVSYVGMRSPVLEFISSFGAVGIWEDNDHYWRFLDRPEVRKIAEKEFEQKLNAKLLAIVSYGNSLIGTNVRPIRTVEDFQNIRVRTAGRAQAVMYRSLGVVPTEITSGEIYMALQRGTIDGACSGPARFYQSKWYEVTPYLTQDHTVPYLSFWLAINLRKWNSLSNEDKALLQKTATDIELWTRDCVLKETEDAYEKLKSVVKELYFMPQEETERIQKLVEPVMYELAVERMGKERAEELWGLLVQTRVGK